MARSQSPLAVMTRFRKAWPSGESSTRGDESQNQ